MTSVTLTTKCVEPAIRLPRWNFLRAWRLHQLRHRRRRATVDLIHSSPHLLRDIGAVEGRIVERRR